MNLATYTLFSCYSTECFSEDDVLFLFLKLLKYEKNKERHVDYTIRYGDEEFIEKIIKDFKRETTKKGTEWSFEVKKEYIKQVEGEKAIIFQIINFIQTGRGGIKKRKMFLKKYFIEKIN